MSKVTYKITVLGNKNCLNTIDVDDIDTTPYFPITFNVINQNNSYYISLQIEDITVTCSKHQSEKNAIQKIKSYMKLAMKGLLLYRRCSYCFDKVYYPFEFCSCNAPIISGEPWITEENEKFKNLL